MLDVVTCRVLVVDDDADVRAIVATTLEHLAGCTVSTVADGESALAAVATDRPDLVVLDVDLGHGAIDGVEVLERLRAAGDRTPVVFLTAYAELLPRRPLDCSGVVHKPFDPVRLPGRLRSLVHQP